MRTAAAILMAFVIGGSSLYAAFWQDDFTAWNPDQYFFHGDTYWRSDGKIIVTTNNPTRYGRLYYTTPFYMGEWRAEFDLYTGGGTPGADGFVFGWVTDYNYVAEDGGSMDFHNANGYGVEFDTYYDAGFDPITANHVSIDHNDFSNHLNYTACNIEDALWHHIVIEFHNGLTTVSKDDQVYLNYAIPGYVPYTGYFGISAATGSAGWNWHVFDNIVVTDLNPPTATPTLSPTFTPLSTHTPTATFTPTAVATHTPTATFSPTAAATNPPTATFSPTSTNTPIATPSPAFSPTITATPAAPAIPSSSPLGIALAVLGITLCIVSHKATKRL